MLQGMHKILSKGTAMQNPILVLNCGSSSIKYALLSNDSSERVAGLAENLGLDTARIKHTTSMGKKLKSLWQAPITNGRCKKY